MTLYCSVAHRAPGGRVLPQIATVPITARTWILSRLVFFSWLLGNDTEAHNIPGSR